MPSRRVPADLNAGTYYLTLTIQRWYYLFDRHNRWQILAESSALLPGEQRAGIEWLCVHAEPHPFHCHVTGYGWIPEGF